jgi:hypothetical protein
MERMLVFTYLCATQSVPINISTVWLSEWDVSVHYLVFLFLLHIVLQCTEVKLFVLWETTLTHMRYFFLYAFTSFCGLLRKIFVLRWNFGGISFSDPSPLSDQMFREGNLTSSPLAFLSVIRRVGMLFLVVTKACFVWCTAKSTCWSVEYGCLF